MKLESNGIIIALKPFGERDAIAHIFTDGHGVLSGMLRGAGTNSKTKPLVGQMGAVAWNARLDSQLGVFHFEAQKNLALAAMMDSNKLAFMNSMFALIETLLPEREPYPNLYVSTIKTLADINPDTYLQWELDLLRDLGYALDLSKCSGCGRTDDLVYLSPRTGRAVCAECGAPYVDKLFRLPINLNTTLRFLHGVCAQQDVSMPEFRNFLQNK
ncbi:MAG: DNA repair protein RecO [Alphaproteobacteria bacterium]|nr:DNA repair protein RecO [Alphaproteobacteria bacterium]